MRSTLAPLVVATAVLGAAAGPALADTARVGGWFITDQRDEDGTLSHCAMTNPYINGPDRVLLTLSLSPERVAMVAVSNSGWTLTEGKTYKAFVALDGGKPEAMPAANTDGVAGLRVPQWPDFSARLREAESLAVKSEGGVVTFRLYELKEAVKALEICASTGKPPVVRRILRDGEGNVVEERTVPPGAAPQPGDQAPVPDEPAPGADGETSPDSAPTE